MVKQYTFREALKEEVPQILQIINQRIAWMEKQGIKQWNTTNYSERYPLAYFEEKRQQGILFVLIDNETDEIACAAVLKEKDDRWDDDAPAIYVHNFVSKIGAKGAGTAFLKLAEKYAAQKGKSYLRLDSIENNRPLAHYYESNGFLPVGKCVDGVYRGILRQKNLRN